MQTKAVEESDRRIKQIKPLRTLHRQFGMMRHIQTIHIFYDFTLLHTMFLDSLKVASLIRIFFFFFCISQSKQNIRTYFSERKLYSSFNWPFICSSTLDMIINVSLPWIFPIRQISPMTLGKPQEFNLINIVILQKEMV